MHGLSSNVFTPHFNLDSPLGKWVKFIPATTLVQQLQQAKLQLQLPAFLVKLDKYDLLIVDDLGYVKKSEAETSVLFELIAHRYERRSLLITANQPFTMVRSELSGYDAVGAKVFIVGMGFNQSWV